MAGLVARPKRLGMEMVSVVAGVGCPDGRKLIELLRLMECMSDLMQVLIGLFQVLSLACSCFESSEHWG